MKRSFGSDNHSGVHEKVMVSILRANEGDEIAYGEDRFTEKVIIDMQYVFGEKAEIFLVFNGTGANTVAIKSMTRSFNAVIAAESSHLHVDECGSTENFCGTKIKVVKTPDGKLTPELLEPLFHGRGDQHHVQPKVISITQSTELGTVYTTQEVKALADFAHEREMFLHMDGARLANAAVHLKTGLAEVSTDCGVDVLSLGGTKNGMMLGEALVVMNPEVAKEMLFFRKQGMQLPSKMRYIAAQFQALFRRSFWKVLADNSNKMAGLLAHGVGECKNVEIVYPVEANAIFAKIPKDKIEELQKHFFFYVWDEDESIVRWMTHWQTSKEDVIEFVDKVKEVVG